MIYLFACLIVLFMFNLCTIKFIKCPIQVNSIAWIPKASTNRLIELYRTLIYNFFPIRTIPRAVKLNRYY